MAVTFIHTADWQLGKPFGDFDETKKPLLRQKRIDSLSGIGRLVEERDARFVVVAGDLFDSQQPTKALVSAACQAIGEMEVPVYVIPGNHDHGGKGGPYDQDYFKSEAAQLAPNLVLMLEPEPFLRDDCVIFPCPLRYRREVGDPTEWLRAFPSSDAYGNLPRIIVAHGSIQDFGQQEKDTDDEFIGAPNLLNLGMLSASEYDYVALGDWHGCREAGMGGKAWYSGTHETDRFPRCDDYSPGHALVVRAMRGGTPVVEPVGTGQSSWKRLVMSLSDDSDIAKIEPAASALFPKGMSGHLLYLTISGPVSLQGETALANVLEKLSARLLGLKLENQTVAAPSPAEMENLIDKRLNPLMGGLAARLLAIQSGPDAAKAKLALRELYRLAIS
jgi:hypothetical protein